MAGSNSSLSGLVMIVGVVVFLIGIVVFCMDLVRGYGVDLMALVAMGVGLGGIVVGRRVGRKAGADAREPRAGAP